MYFFPVKKLGGSHFQKHGKSRSAGLDTHSQEKNKEKKCLCRNGYKKENNIAIMVDHFPHYTR